MPNGDPRDRFFYPTLTLMIDSNNSTRWSAIKEEAKAANCDWVDHQACSLLQYINVKANLFIMGNYFNELS